MPPTFPACLKLILTYCYPPVMTRRLLCLMAATAWGVVPATTWAQDEYQTEVDTFVDDSLFAEEPEVSPRSGGGVKDIEVQEAPPRPIAQEFTLDFSYVGAAEMKQGNRRLGQTDEYQMAAQYVVSPEVSENVLLRAGVDFEKFSFGTPNNAPFPNTLNMLNVIVGADILAGDQWLLRVQAMPGIYNMSSDIRGKDINVPLVFGGTYLMSKDVQIIFGVSLDLWREYPVLPGAGIRWAFADKWVLSAIPPSPKLEYEYNNQWTFYVGADLLGDTYRADDDFGVTHGNGKLDNAIMSYWELRTGAGFVFKPIPNIKVDVSGGAMVYRTMDFHRANTTFSNDEAAPYAAIRISGQF